MAGVEVRRESLESQPAYRLITELNAELTERYPEAGATHFRLDADEVAPGRGAFLVALIDGDAVGCGAVRRIEDGVVEVKRMYVRPAARGRGSAATFSQRSKRRPAPWAPAGSSSRRACASPRRLPSTGALASRSIPPFGEYVDSPLSVCMAKDLG